MEENNIENLFDDSVEDFDYDRLSEILGLDVRELENSLNETNPKINLPYTNTLSNSNEPSYAYDTDSGFDLHSSIGVEIPPFGRALVPTGLHFDIPDGYEIQVRSKSGLALKQGLMVLNSPGTVDQGYTGEVMAIIFNTTNDVAIINKGQKVAQAVLCPVVAGKWVNLVKVNNIEDKDRSDKGFGSTGI